MQLWLRPPNRRAIQYGFRIFFALNLLGALNALWRQLLLHPITRETWLPTLELTAASLALVATMCAVMLWSTTRMQRRLEQRTAHKQQGSR